MRIIITPSAEDVARTAADIITPYANAGATLGVATGSSPLGTYRELIARYHRGDVSFVGCRAFTLDEYIGLAPTDEQSYYSTIRREFTDHIDIDPARVCGPDGTAEDPHEAARRYESSIVDAGGIDIQLLGIGSNGHIGFNEPGSSLNSRTRIKTLHPSTIKDNARFFDSADGVPIHVITQGLGTIQRAGHLLLIALGEGKAEAVRAMIEGPVAASCPASVLQLHEKATVVIDEPAANALTDATYHRFVEEHPLDAGHR